MATFLWILLALWILSLVTTFAGEGGGPPPPGAWGPVRIAVTVALAMAGLVVLMATVNLILVP